MFWVQFDSLLLCLFVCLSAFRQNYAKPTHLFAINKGGSMGQRRTNYILVWSQVKGQIHVFSFILATLQDWSDGSRLLTVTYILKSSRS